MRSRFTAHVLRDYRHLHRTYLGTVREAYMDPVDEAAVDWTRLVILSEEPGAKEGTAFVDFTAFYDEAGSEHAQHEHAEFVRHDGSWIYSRAVRTGSAPSTSTTPNVGRNDPCPCGSGKRFKHCCGRGANAPPGHVYPARELLARIVRSGGRMDRLIQDLLTYSRISR